MTVTRERLAAIPPEKRDLHLEQMRAELRETDTEEAAS